VIELFAGLAVDATPLAMKCAQGDFIQGPDGLSVTEKYVKVKTLKHLYHDADRLCINFNLL